LSGKVRVFAILDARPDTNVVRLLGFGEHVGDAVPDVDAGGVGPFLHDMGIRNPKIVLDDGTVVWGCECWWGPEEEFSVRFSSPPWKIEKISSDYFIKIRSTDREGQAEEAGK